MIIKVFNRQKDLSIDKGSVKTLVDQVLTHLEIFSKEVAIYFVTPKKISELHGQFFQDPTPTDCISFPIDETHLGEVFVCPAVAIRYAAKNHLNPYEETSLYVIHGLLHLLGYDDLEPKARRIMRKMEKRCMHWLYETKSFLR